MTQRHLDRLLKPASVAVLGASNRPGSLGAAVWRALRRGGFGGSLWPVNPHHAQLDGVPAFAHPSDLPAAPELALVCTPAPTVAPLLASLGAAGCRAAVVLTPGLPAAPLRQAAQDHGLRLLGPGSAGLLSPAAGLWATRMDVAVRAGPLALVAQSGSLAAALLAEADVRGMGFTHVVTLGAQADVDLADLLDHLALDGATRTILLQAGSVGPARRFMAAARAAARRKPVIVLRSGREDRAADAAHDAAFSRAGLWRVDTLDQMLDAAALPPVVDGPLLIVGNGQGVVQLAADAAVRSGWAVRAVTLPHEAPAAQWCAALAAPLPGQRLLVHLPSPALPTQDLVAALQAAPLPGPLLACWLGQPVPAAAVASGLASHRSPEAAVQALARRQRWQRDQALLHETPDEHPLPVVDRPAADRLLARLQREGRPQPDTLEALGLLAAFGITAGPAAGAEAGILCVGTAIDPVFGPVLRCAEAGQIACGLPPLDRRTARELLGRLHRGHRLAQQPALVDLLVALSQLLAEWPPLAELTLQCDDEGRAPRLLSLGLADPPPAGAARFTIAPYPAQWTRQAPWRGRTVTLRPIRPDDEARHAAFLNALSADDLRLRFFHTRRDLAHEALARLTQVDHERELAFIAEADGQTLGVVRAALDPDLEEAEFGLAVRSDLKRGGLGRLLLLRLVEHLRAQGTQRLVGHVLAENLAMRRLAEQIGLRTDATRGEPGVECWVMDLQRMG